jgi:hypothetical protein
MMSRVFYNHILIILIFGCLLLGQLARINLTPQIAFYYHDVLIVIFILLNLPELLMIGTKIWTSMIGRKKTLIVMALGVSWLIITWILSAPIALVTGLYLLRLMTYLIFLVVFALLRPINRQQLFFLLIGFFFLFTLLGLGQYLFFPDARSLGYLGWDDHYYRLINTWFDPAFTGLVFVLAVIFLLDLRKKKLGKLKSSFFLSLIFLLLVALCLTVSRANLLAMGGVMIVWGWWQYQSGGRRFFTGRLFFLTLLTLILAGAGFFITTRQHWGNALWRTNSIVLRLATFQAELSALTVKDWLIGRGLFVPSKNLILPDDLPQKSTPTLRQTDISWQQTGIFADNFFLLLIGFFGLPLTLIVIFYLGKFLFFTYFAYPSIFLSTMALLINAQFNQVVFQPFILLIFGFLLIYYWFDKTFKIKPPKA